MTKEWYFQEGQERIGPITASALKQLAETGRIKPETLVWKNGTREWVAARTVRGLIGTPGLAASSPPLSLRDNAPDSQPPDDAAWHPFDALLRAARLGAPPRTAAAISRGAGTAGIYLAYAAAFITLLGAIVFAIHDNNFSDIAGLSMFAVAMLVAQYCSTKSLHACETMIRLNPSTISSVTFPDSLVIATWLGAVATGVWLIWYGLSTKDVFPALASALVVIPGLHACLTMLHPAELSVSIRHDCTTSTDAIGLLSFITKVSLRCAPVLFLAAVIAGTAGEVTLLVRFMRADFKASPFDANEIRFGFGFMAGLLVNAIAIPFYIQLGSLFNYLTLDTLSALVSLPTFFDALTKATDSSRRRDD